MSGRTKKILYHTADWLLGVVAILGVLMLALFAVPHDFGTEEWTVYHVLFAVLLLRLHVLMHELGHLLFGLFAGMKPVSFTISFLRFSSKGVKFVGYSNFAGATEAFPKDGKNVRARMTVFTLGGSIFNLLIGIGLTVAFFCCEYHPMLLFGCAFAVFLIAEGIRALIPAELSAGKTDGAVLLGIAKRLPEEEITLNVLTAQGILFRGVFADIPRGLLFETPVVREDLPAFHALLMLRAQYLLAAGEEDEAKNNLERLVSLSEYLCEEQTREAERYLAYFKGEFSAEKAPLYGVRVLEEQLKSAKKNSAGGRIEGLLNL